MMSDLVSGVIGYGLNVASQERAFRQQKELQGDAQSYNTQMWNMANAYNSPLSQMQRFKAAGLNPNLIYGQMNQGASAPSLSTSSAPSPAHSPDMSLLEGAQLSLLSAQKENIQADTASKLADVGESGSRIKLNDALIEKYGHDNDWTDQQIDESKAQVAVLEKHLDEMDAAIVKLKAEGRLVNAEAVLKEIDQLFAEERNRAEIDNILANSNLTNKQAKEISFLMLAKKANLESSTAYNRAAAGAQRTLKQLYIQQARREGIAADVAEKQADAQVQMLLNALESGSIEADMARDYPSLMKGLKIWEKVLGPVSGIVNALILRGGMGKIGSNAAAARDARHAEYVAGDAYSSINGTW